MGMSMPMAASNTLDAWANSCRNQHPDNGSNQYRGKDGRLYFFEIPWGKDYDAVTGPVYRYTPDEKYVQRCGSFRVEADGRVTRKPTSWPF